MYIDILSCNTPKKRFILLLIFGIKNCNIGAISDLIGEREFNAVIACKEKAFIPRIIAIFLRDDYYLMFLCLTTWFNFLQLDFMGIHSNVLLIPFVVYTFFREVLFLIVFLKDKNGNHVVIGILRYLFQTMGILPFDGERQLSLANQLVLRAPRLLYFWYLLSTFLHAMRNRSFARHTFVQIVLFYIIIVTLSRFIILKSKSQQNSEDLIAKEMSICFRVIFIISFLTGLIHVFMMLFNVQLMSGSTVIGIYGKGLFGIMGNPNSVGIASGIAIIVSLYMIRHATIFRQKMSAYVNLVIHFFTLVFCNSRTTLLALMLSCFCTFIFSLFIGAAGRYLSRILILSMVSLILLTVFVKPYMQEHYFQNHLNSSVQGTLSLEFLEPNQMAIEEREKRLAELETEVTQDDSSPVHYIFGKAYPLSVREVYLGTPWLVSLDEFLTGRIQLWKEAWLLFGSNILSGYGFYKYNIAFGQMVSPVGHVVKTGISSSHNLFFDMLWMGGILGFVLGVVLFFSHYFALLFKAIQWLKYFFKKKKDKAFNSSLPDDYQMELLFLMLLGLFIGMIQMFEVTAITIFNMSTVCFWLFLRWNVLSNQKCSEQFTLLKSKQKCG